MLVKKLLLAALVAVTSVSAAPGATEASLAERGDKNCLSGKVWSGFNGKCVCDGDDDKDDDDYDYEEGRCRPKSHPRSPCGHDEKQYCAKGVDEWCEYDKKNKICYDDKSSKVFCSKPEDLHKKIQELCPSHPPCHGPRHWDYYQNRCECSKGKVWHNDNCVWKPHHKPDCHDKKAFCAKDADHFCPYDEWNPWCGDNNRNIVFCADDKHGKPEKKCKNKWNKGKWNDDED